MLHAARLASLALFASWVLNAQPSLFLYLSNNPPEAFTERSMKVEFASLMEPLGYGTTWRTLLMRRNEGEEGQLIVVKLIGDCSTTAPATRVSSGMPIANVQEVDGRILPFIDVHCGVLTGMLQPALKDLPAYQQRWLLGRAIARVLVHEVYHITVQTHDHREKGLAKAKLNGYELTSELRRGEPMPVIHAATPSSLAVDAAAVDGR
jgi:hypothetical protein